LEARLYFRENFFGGNTIVEGKNFRAKIFLDKKL
jgi:hypothetical protein